jgi:hypothetical protein
MRVFVIGAACAVLLAPAAMAGHGKVGTWQVTTKMGGMDNAMVKMPDMSKMPPEVQARMKAHGVQMNPGGGMTTKYCMTEDQVKNDKPQLTRPDSPCKVANMSVKGNTFSADVVCTGEMNGKGHTEVTFDSPEHYKGHQTMTMTRDGQTMTHEMFMDAKWLSPTCTVPTGH